MESMSLDTLRVVKRQMCWWWGAPGLKITQQTLKSSVIGIVRFPRGKVPNMSLLADSCGPRFGCLHDGLIQFEGKEHQLPLRLLLLQGLVDFVFDPGTFDGMLRKDDDELVIHADSLINVGLEFVANFQIFAGIPATHVVGLQVGIEAFNKRLVFAGVTNEAGVVRDGALDQRAGIGDEGITQACFAQEALRNITFGAQEGICSNGRGCQMVKGVQSFRGAQVNISKDRQSHCGSAEDSSAEDSSAEVGMAEVGCSEVGSAEVGMAEDGFFEVGKAEVGSDEVGSAEVGSAEEGFVEVSCSEVGSSEVSCDEVGMAEVGSAEVGCSEVGSAEVEMYTPVLFSPDIQGCHSLPENIKLLLVCHRVGSLLCSAFIIERYRSLRKIISFCSFSSYSYEVVHHGASVVPLETRCLNADFGGKYGVDESKRVAGGQAGDGKAWAGASTGDAAIRGSGGADLVIPRC